MPTTAGASLKPVRMDMFSRTVRIETTLEETEAVSRMAALVGEEGSRPFRGHADETGFAIDEIREYRTSFLPRVRGTYVRAPGGVNLSLSLRPHREVIIFLAVWATFLLFASILIVAFALPARTGRLLLLIAPAALGALTFYLSFRVFRSDCRWTLESLKEHLLSEEASGEHHAGI